MLLLDGCCQHGRPCWQYCQKTGCYQASSLVARVWRRLESTSFGYKDQTHVCIGNSRSCLIENLNLRAFWIHFWASFFIQKCPFSHLTGENRSKTEASALKVPASGRSPMAVDLELAKGIRWMLITGGIWLLRLAIVNRRRSSSIQKRWQAISRAIERFSKWSKKATYWNWNRLKSRRVRSNRLKWRVLSQTNFAIRDFHSKASPANWHAMLGTAVWCSVDTHRSVEWNSKHTDASHTETWLPST